MPGLDLTTKLIYEKDYGPGQIPYIFTFDPSPEEATRLGRTGGKMRGEAVEVELVVRDGRCGGLTLDQHGFQLTEQPTSLTTAQFYQDEERVKKEYYREVEELIRRETGAELVIAFHHQVNSLQTWTRGRCRAPDQVRAKDHNATAETGTVSTVQPYAYGVHSDSHPKSARDLFLGVVAGRLGHQVHQ